MLPLLFLLCNTAPIHLEGDVAEAGGDYVVVPFDVPAGMVEVQVAHSDGSPEVILDWGVWQPDGGFRGWGGGLGDDAIIGVDESSRGYLEGPIPAGTWSLVIGKAKLAQGAGRYVVDVTCRPTATLTPTARAGYTPTVLATVIRPSWLSTSDFTTGRNCASTPLLCPWSESTTISSSLPVRRRYSAINSRSLRSRWSRYLGRSPRVCCRVLSPGR